MFFILFRIGSSVFFWVFAIAFFIGVYINFDVEKSKKRQAVEKIEFEPEPFDQFLSRFVADDKFRRLRNRSAEPDFMLDHHIERFTNNQKVKKEIVNEDEMEYKIKTLDGTVYTYTFTHHQRAWTLQKVD